MLDKGSSALAHVAFLIKRGLLALPEYIYSAFLIQVRRLLCSSRPVAVRMANPPDVSDPDMVAQQQVQGLTCI